MPIRFRTFVISDRLGASMKTKLFNTFVIIASTLTLLVFFGACKKSGGKSAVVSDTSAMRVEAHQVEVNSVFIEEGQLVVVGNNLSDVSKVLVTQGTNQHTLTVASKSATELKLSPLDALNFIIGATYNLIITNAYGSEINTISFTIDANSIETGMIQDGAITSGKIDSMEAQSGQVLRYGVNGWAPSNSNERDYVGLWSPSEGTPDSVTSIGDYYLVDVAGSWNGSNWDVGDQIVWNGTGWDRIPAFSPISTVFGRRGTVVAQTGDYTWNQINKTISSIFDIANVDGTGIADGKVLKWNADLSKFVVADDVDSPADGFVAEVNGRTGQVVLTTDDVNEGSSRQYFTVLRARATLSATAPIVYNATSGVISILPATGSAAGTMSAADKTKFDASNANWDTAYTDRYKWSGVSDGLNDVMGRASLNLGTLATQNADDVAITGGTIDGSTVGAGINADNITSGTLSTDRFNSLSDLGGGTGSGFLRKDLSLIHI